jgi:multiple sugar transport system ATP-binding protein
MVFQSYALYPHMTVAQNIGFGLRMRGAPKHAIGSRVLEIADLLGIKDLLDRRPKELSGGQRQRVAMGRALVRRPKLFLLDEPLSNLDARLRINVRIELKKLHQQLRSTVLYVTHDQVEAMTLGDKVVVMKDGRVVQWGTPEMIYDSPADTFVATFIGSPAMNLFQGTLTGHGRLRIFQSGNLSVASENFPSDIDGRNVEMGLRPEDIELVTSGRLNRPKPEVQDRLTADVEMISNVGSEKYIHARIGTTPFTLRAPKNSQTEPGERISLFVDPLKAHFFIEGRRV